MIKTDFTITTNHALGLIGLISVGVVAYRSYRAARDIVTTDLNPASSENIVYRNVRSDTTTAIADHFFGAVDLVNPFNDSDVYARQVWGLDNN